MARDSNVKTNGKTTDGTRTAEVAVDELDALDAAIEYFKEYAREKPEVVTLWAFGIGFVLGWKLKPW